MQNKSASYNIDYHLVWCPKYHKSILEKPEVKQFLEEQVHTLAVMKGSEAINPKRDSQFLSVKREKPIFNELNDKSPISVMNTIEIASDRSKKNKSQNAKAKR